MPTIKQILFPFDFSEQCSKAVPFVRAMATRFDARITLISVVPPMWEVTSTAMPVMGPVDTQEIERALKSRLDLALAEELAGLSVQQIAKSGDPALKIAEFAHKNGVDLIMMPTHGYGLFRSLLIGSVTAKVLHDARCPVWTATHTEKQQARDVPRTILCAIDGSSGTPALMKWGAEYSRQTGALLKLLHVLPPISDWLALPAEREIQEQMRAEARSTIEPYDSPQASRQYLGSWLARSWTQSLRKQGRKGPIWSLLGAVLFDRIWGACARMRTG